MGCYLGIFIKTYLSLNTGDYKGFYSKVQKFLVLLKP